MATPLRTGGTSATGGYATTGNAGCRGWGGTGTEFPGGRATCNARMNAPGGWEVMLLLIFALMIYGLVRLVKYATSKAQR